VAGDRLGRGAAGGARDRRVPAARPADGGGRLRLALDADTDGEEGLTYVWTPAQLADALGDEDGRWAAEQFDVTASGTFEHGSSVLQRLAEPDDPERYERVRSRLLEVRAARPQPARDDKVVAAWNGLAIAALAESGVLLDRPDHVAAAVACADLLRDLHVVDGRLLRTSIGGRAGRNAGVLEDHADVAEGLLALFAASPATCRASTTRGACSTSCCSTSRRRRWLLRQPPTTPSSWCRRPQDLTDSATAVGARRGGRGAADLLGR
jgi:hypothetical protein